MGGCSSFMTPEELEQIQVDYRKARWFMTEGRDNIVKAAVEWYEAGMLLDAQIKSGVMEGYEVTQRKAWDAELALADAVKRWKEAQA